MCSQGRQMCTEGPWDRAGLCSIPRGTGDGKQAADAGRMVSPLPVPCETAGNSVIVYSSCGMWGVSVNWYFTMAYLPGPCFGVGKVGQGGRK